MSLRYFITDGHSLDAVARVLAAGIDWVQIREKDLSARDLAAHVRDVLRLSNPHGAKILVNDRADVALACGAHGVHLRARSVAPEAIRRISPPDFLIGVSSHFIEEVMQAEDEGASFVVFGPVFEAPGKGAAVGLRALAQAAHSVSIPVLALGGVSRDKISVCLRMGAGGVAGIRVFQGLG